MLLELHIWLGTQGPAASSRLEGHSLDLSGQFVCAADGIVGHG